MMKKLLFAIAALVFSQSATQAEIVYNPGTTSINSNIDFNNDSVYDIVLSSSFMFTNAIPPTTSDYYFFDGKSFAGSDTHDGLTEKLNARFLVNPSSQNKSYASSLSLGTLVGQTSPQDSLWSELGENVGVLSLLSLNGGPTTQTPNIVGTEYFGFQFLIGSETHYGWMLVDRRPYSELEPVGESGLFLVQQSGPRVLSWAYETNPNTAIAVAAIPEPASYGVVVFASLCGAFVMRRKLNRN